MLYETHVTHNITDRILRLRVYFA